MGQFVLKSLGICFGRLVFLMLLGTSSMSLGAGTCPEVLASVGKKSLPRLRGWVPADLPGLNGSLNVQFETIISPAGDQAPLSFGAMLNYQKLKLKRIRGRGVDGEQSLSHVELDIGQAQVLFYNTDQVHPNHYGLEFFYSSDQLNHRRIVKGRPDQAAVSVDLDTSTGIAYKKVLASRESLSKNFFFVVGTVSRYVSGTQVSYYVISKMSLTDGLLLRSHHVEIPKIEHDFFGNKYNPSYEWKNPQASPHIEMHPDNGHVLYISGNNHLIELDHDLMPVRDTRLQRYKAFPMADVKMRGKLDKDQPFYVLAGNKIAVRAPKDKILIYDMRTGQLLGDVSPLAHGVGLISLEYDMMIRRNVRENDYDVDRFLRDFPHFNQNMRLWAEAHFFAEQDFTKVADFVLESDNRSGLPLNLAADSKSAIIKNHDKVEMPKLKDRLRNDLQLMEQARTYQKLKKMQPKILWVAPVDGSDHQLAVFYGFENSISDVYLVIVSI